MKKFARCVLILIIVTVLSGVVGYAIVSNKITPMYTSTTQIYIVPGEANEASLRTSNGSLNQDFAMIFTSNVVISDAQKTAGTSEDIASYITVKAPANSNIIEITCTNPDQNTAKTYVDAVAKSALKTTSIIPVEKISILTEGTSTGVSIKPELTENTVKIIVIAFAACLAIEVIVLLFISAFKQKVVDEEEDYNRIFGISHMQQQAQPEAAVTASTSVMPTGGADKTPEYEKRVQQEHPIEPDILDGMEDDLEGYDILDDDESNTDAIAPVKDNSSIEFKAKEKIKETIIEVENEVAVTSEESSAEVLGRIPR